MKLRFFSLLGLLLSLSSIVAETRDPEMLRAKLDNDLLFAVTKIEEIYKDSKQPDLAMLLAKSQAAWKQYRECQASLFRSASTSAQSTHEESEDAFFQEYARISMERLNSLGKLLLQLRAGNRGTDVDLKK